MTDDERPADSAREPPDANGGDLVGAGVARREDHALLTGRATFTDDLSKPGMVHLAFVRSEYAHARIEGIDTAGAEAVDGVRAVYTWDDLADSDAPGVIPIAADRLDSPVPGHPVLSRGRVRYQGEPIAAVVGDDRYAARDGVAAVDVTYDRLDPVVDPVAAIESDAPALYDEAPDNVLATSELGDREATAAEFDAADRVVDLELTNNRLIPSALEPRAALASWDAGSERLTVEMTSQSPHGHRRKLAETLALPERQIRVVAPSVGGGFGHKGHHHPGEAMAAWASMRLERPVKWTATRSENYRAGAHGRDHRTEAAMALDSDGTIRGIRVETIANVGGYGLGGAPAMPGWYGRLLASQYDVPAIHCETRAVVTNTAPVHSYRGAGRPEAIYVTERLVDVAARELELDPVDLRRRNLIPPDDFPHETAVGASYDSGEYEAALDRALSLAANVEGDADTVDGDAGTGDGDADAVDGTANPSADWRSALPNGGERDDEGRLRGVGVANFVESTGGGFESGLVRVHPDGTVTVFAGSHSHGQGHETTYAQIVADELALSPDDVDVVEGDTDAIPTGTGTFGSRSTIVAGNAIREGAGEVRAKARRIAAHQLGVDEGDLVLEDGAFSTERNDEDERLSADGGTDGGERVDGDDPDAITFGEIASEAYGGGLPEDLDRGLEATCFYEPDGTAYAFGTHVAAVAVDPGTGTLEIERYVAVDDCGPRVNPTIVEGQVHGGVAQGIGQATSEHAIYDETGRLRTDSMFAYALPRAADVPDFETGATETPSPRNPLGVKGIGEAGTIAAPPTVVSAVCDALCVDHVDMPLTAERLLSALDDASE